MSTPKTTHRRKSRWALINELGVVNQPRRQQLAALRAHVEELRARLDDTLAAIAETERDLTSKARPVAELVKEYTDLTDVERAALGKEGRARFGF